MRHKKPLVADVIADLAKRDAAGASDSMALVSCLRQSNDAPAHGLFQVIVTDKQGNKMPYIGKREYGEWVGVYGLDMANRPAWIPYITHWVDVTMPDDFYDN